MKTNKIALVVSNVRAAWTFIFFKKKQRSLLLWKACKCCVQTQLERPACQKNQQKLAILLHAAESYFFQYLMHCAPWDEFMLPLPQLLHHLVHLSLLVFFFTKLYSPILRRGRYLSSLPKILPFMQYLINVLLFRTSSGYTFSL